MPRHDEVTITGGECMLTHRVVTFPEPSIIIEHGHATEQ